MASEHDLDAHLQLRSDEDNIIGTLFIGPKAPPTEISAHVLSVYLDSKGVVDRCIDTDALNAIAERFKAHPGAEQIAEVARGRPPRHGKPRTLSWSDSISERIDEIEVRNTDTEPGSPSPPDQLTSTEDEDNSINHYDHSAFIVVGASEPLGTITPADPGEDGENIFGERIPAKQSPTPSYIDTSSIELTESNQVVARNGGHLLYSGSRRSVERTLTVQGDVGFATGHVQFPGPVIVKGGVKDHFRIASQGDTTVRMLIEAAHIRANRDIHLDRGVAGRETATLDAHRNIHAGYLESTAVTANGDCIVQREITNCTISVRGSVIIENGAVRGGEIIAAHRFEASVLGSAQEVRTEITVGSIPELDDLLTQIRSLCEPAEIRRQDLMLKVESIRSAMDTNNPDAIEKTMGLDFEISELTQRINQLKAAAERIRENLRAQTDPAVTVHRRIHPGVTIRLRGHAVSFKDDFDGPFTLRVNKAGDLLIDQHGNERPASEVASVVPDASLENLLPPQPVPNTDDAGDRTIGDGLVSDSGQQAA